MRKVLIEPSLLSANFSNLEKDIRQCEEGGADLLHLDIMDGRFVPNITFGPVVVEAIRRTTSLPLVCHLMIVEPERYIVDFVNAGADYISIHCEGQFHINRTLESIRTLGKKAGLALNPGTPLEFAFENAEYCDFILLMSVNPGFGGQSFIPSFLRRAETLKNFLIKSRLDNVLIEVDGGIKIENVQDAVRAGADMIVSGSGLFNGNIAENIRRMRAKIEKELNENSSKK
ncbi:MAG: Ribulose-phosphate 3-epimerase [Candidatus Kapaibacterium sp.]|nr:MAG: Ribulose-phosphate 3-epimerase [Candidatus Kapabacteria bacterium]